MECKSCDYFDRETKVCDDNAVFLNTSGERICRYNSDAIIRCHEMERLDKIIDEYDIERHLVIKVPWLFLVNFCFFQFFFCRLAFSYKRTTYKASYSFIYKKPFTGWRFK